MPRFAKNLPKGVDKSVKNCYNLINPMPAPLGRAYHQVKAPEGVFKGKNQKNRK